MSLKKINYVSEHCSCENAHLCQSIRDFETIKNYPQLPPEHGDLALCLLLAQTPLDGVEAIVRGQGDVPSTDCRADRTCQDVRLRVETDAHSVGVHYSQSAVVAQLIAVPHLICRGGRDEETL